MPKKAVYNDKMAVAPAVNDVVLEHNSKNNKIVSSSPSLEITRSANDKALIKQEQVIIAAISIVSPATSTILAPSTQRLSSDSVTMAAGEDPIISQKKQSKKYRDSVCLNAEASRLDAKFDDNGNEIIPEGEAVVSGITPERRRRGVSDPSVIAMSNALYRTGLNSPTGSYCIADLAKELKGAAIGDRSSISWLDKRDVFDDSIHYCSGRSLSYDGNSSSANLSNLSFFTHALNSNISSGSVGTAVTALASAATLSNSNKQITIGNADSSNTYKGNNPALKGANGDVVVDYDGFLPLGSRRFTDPSDGSLNKKILKKKKQQPYRRRSEINTSDNSSNNNNHNINNTNSINSYNNTNRCNNSLNQCAVSTANESTKYTEIDSNINNNNKNMRNKDIEGSSSTVFRQNYCYNSSNSSASDITNNYSTEKHTDKITPAINHFVDTCASNSNNDNHSSKPPPWNHDHIDIGDVDYLSDGISNSDVNSEYDDDDDDEFIDCATIDERDGSEVGYDCSSSRNIEVLNHDL